MFVGMSNVSDIGNVKIDTQYIEVEQGKSATFKIIVDNTSKIKNVKELCTLVFETSKQL